MMSESSGSGGNGGGSGAMSDNSKIEREERQSMLVPWCSWIVFRRILSLAIADDEYRFTKI